MPALPVTLWAPISRLPPELLSLVFCHLRDIKIEQCDSEYHHDAFERPFEFQRKFAVENWMKISHVCHSWREVALNTVSLWSHLIVTRSSYKWAEECLRRSKESSLVLFAHFSGANGLNSHHPSRALLRELKNHIGRCRVLNLQLATEDLIDLLSQTNTSHLVQFHYCYRSDSAGSRLFPPLIDDSLLRADSLRRLSISSCPIDWTASIFRRLTHLKLYCIPEEFKLECHTFVSFLVGMPQLEVLDLCDFLRMENSEGNRRQADGTHLQHLKYVELRDNPQALAGFLSSLPIPPLCKLCINGEGSPATAAEELLPILSWVSNHFRPPISGSPNASGTHHNYWRSLRIYHFESCFGYEGYIEENLREQNKVLFQHCIWLPEDTDDFDEVPNLPQPLFTPLPISHIVYLEINGDSDNQWSVLSKSMWINIFGSISTLESICIHSAQSLPFFQALLPYDPNDLDSEPMPFPGLSSVSVERDNPDYDLILRSLLYRFQHGAALKRLVLDDCSEIASSDLERLQEVVGEAEVKKSL